MAKRFSAVEIRTIFEMKEKGYKVREIADKIHRSTKSVNMFVARYRKADPAKMQEMLNKKTEELPSVEEVFDKMPDKAPGFVKPEVVEKTTPSATICTVSGPSVQVKAKGLADYSSRDLIKCLYDRGYRIRNNDLYRILEQKVLLTDIISA